MHLHPGISLSALSHLKLLQNPFNYSPKCFKIVHKLSMASAHLVYVGFEFFRSKAGALRSSNYYLLEVLVQGGSSS